MKTAGPTSDLRMREGYLIVALLRAGRAREALHVATQQARPPAPRVKILPDRASVA